MAELAQNSIDVNVEKEVGASSKANEKPDQAMAYHPATSSTLKRMMDIIISALGLLLLSPIFGLVAVLIKLDSPGPVVFRQERAGLDGKLFQFYKFRSMYQDSSSEAHKTYIRELIHGKARPHTEFNGGEKVFKLAEDDRITKFGKMLRRTSLDELPQLLNVLRGDMSLVGPRPAIGYEIEIYKDWYGRRLSVLPGMTGLWQISGRSERTFDEMVELDLEYVDNWSLLCDFKILWRTIFVVFKRQGAW